MIKATRHDSIDAHIIFINELVHQFFLIQFFFFCKLK